MGRGMEGTPASSFRSPAILTSRDPCSCWWSGCPENRRNFRTPKIRNTAFLSPANPRPQRSQTRSHQLSLPAARVVIVSRSATRGRPGVLAPRTYTVRCARAARLGRPERGQQQAPYPHPHCGDHSGGPRGLWALAKGSDSTCEEPSRTLLGNTGRHRDTILSKGLA